LYKCFFYKRVSVLIIFLNILMLSLFISSCASTDKNISGSETTSTYTSSTSSSEGSEVLELKAKVDELNNRIYVMNEQIEGLRARLREEKLPSATNVKAKTKTETKILAAQPSRPSKSKSEASAGALSAEEKIVKDFLGTKTAEPVVDSKPSALTKSKNAMYNNYLSAYAFFKEKKYARSLIAFSSFIDEYPNTILTDNAYFWLAESYFKKKEYVLAIQEFLKILEKFPDSSKAPYAALSLSYAYDKIGDKVSSEKIKRLLFQKYPKSLATGLSISANNFGG
jgi:tol-pal system protein YbgF